MLLNRTLLMQMIYSGSGLPDDTSSVQELMASSLLVVRFTSRDESPSGQRFALVQGRGNDRAGLR